MGHAQNVAHGVVVARWVVAAHFAVLALGCSRPEREVATPTVVVQESEARGGEENEARGGEEPAWEEAPEEEKAQPPPDVSIAECDAYLALLRQCIDSADTPSEAAAFQQAVEKFELNEDDIEQHPEIWERLATMCLRATTILRREHSCEKP